MNKNLINMDPKLDKKSLFRVLDIDGKKIDEKYKTTLKNKEIINGYEYMVLSRQQDTYMSQLQRQGRMLTFAPNFGEEALQVAASMAMDKDDWLVPSFRNNAAMLHRGIPVKTMMRYWNGNEDGSNFGEDIKVLPINIVIATQISHNAGIAYALKQQGLPNISVTFIGDGGTSEGEFYEAINVAAVKKWPAVFCVNNNQWAISTPTEKETVSATIAAKGVAMGIPAIRVDGNDLLASYEAMKQASEYSRNGNGPILVEFITWRQGVHTSSDNPRIYRTDEQEKNAELWEPMHRIEKYMIDNKILTKSKIKEIWDSKLNDVKEAFKESLIDLDESIDEVFDHTYKVLPEELQQQKADVVEYFKNKGDK